jgi:hypothetical protein
LIRAIVFEIALRSEVRLSSLSSTVIDSFPVGRALPDTTWLQPVQAGRLTACA